MIGQNVITGFNHTQNYHYIDKKSNGIVHRTIINQKSVFFYSTGFNLVTQLLSLESKPFEIQTESNDYISTLLILYKYCTRKNKINDKSKVMIR